MNEVFETRLMENCTQFLETKKAVINNKLESLELQKVIAMHELDARKKVLSAVDDNGKSLYSNEEKRNIAQKELLANNQEYNDALAKQDRLTIENVTLDGQIEMLKYEKSIIQSIMAVNRNE